MDDGLNMTLDICLSSGYKSLIGWLLGWEMPYKYQTA